MSIFYSNDCVDKAEKGEEKNLGQAKEGMDVRRERMCGRLRGRAPARSGSGGRSGATRSRAASLGEVIKTFYAALEYTLFKLKNKYTLNHKINS